MISLAILLLIGFGSACSNSDVTSTAPLTSSDTPPTLATISIGATPGKAISPTFMGLSHEWGVQTTMGRSATGVDYIYRQMLKNLMAYGSGPLVLRIGGNSTDKTGLPTSTTALPFAELAKALGVHFYLGVNLGGDVVALAADQTEAYINQMPARYLDGIEIGNEPDDYVHNKMRSAPYTFQNYLKDFDTWKANIGPLLPSTKFLMGASWSETAMLPNAPTYLASESKALEVFSLHNYLGSVRKLSQNDVLLQPSMSTTAPAAVISTVVAAHDLGIPFRIGEIGAFYDPTHTSVDNAFESALWAVDIMFEFANVGVDGVNWHGTPSRTEFLTSFNIANNTVAGVTTYSLSAVRPLYYGLLLFQEATGHKAHLLPVNLNTNANFKAWATVDASGTPRLVLINKDEISSGTVSVAPPAGFTHAQIVRLTAPSYLSTTGVTLAGQTFDGSKDGTIQGTRSTTTLRLVDRVFRLPMPITSAALIVFSR